MLDATAVVPDRKGLGRFQARLIAELRSRHPELIQATVLTQRGFDEAWPQLPGWSVAEMRGRRDLVRSTIAIPNALRRIRPQVYIASADRVLAPSGLPVLLYVFEHPAYRTRMQRLTSNTWRQRSSDAITVQWFKRSLARANRIVTASTSTARDLVFLAGVDPTKISVAMPGPFIPVGNAGSTPRERVVLTFIDRDPRDNGLAVIDGFVAGAAIGWQLHVVGNADPWVMSYAKQSGAIDRVRFLGQLPDRALSDLYERAAIYLDGSLYEGFGAQAAEATASGQVCVVSNVTSLPESAGPAAVLVNPHDPSTIAEALARLTKKDPADLALGSQSVSASTGARWELLSLHITALAQELARST